MKEFRQVFGTAGSGPGVRRCRKGRRNGGTASLSILFVQAKGYFYKLLFLLKNKTCIAQIKALPKLIQGGRSQIQGWNFLVEDFSLSMLKKTHLFYRDEKKWFEAARSAGKRLVFAEMGDPSPSSG